MRIHESRFEKAAELFYQAVAVPDLLPSALEFLGSSCSAMGVNLMPVRPGCASVLCSPSLDGIMEDLISSESVPPDSHFLIDPI